MAIRKRKPTSAGRRFQTVSDFAEITTTRPEKSLLAPKPSTGGRNNHGRITSNHMGGGHKQRLRTVDFKRRRFDVAATVERLEYDPNRSAFIALIKMLIGPIIFTTVVVGLAGLGDLRRAGKLGLRALVYFEAVTTLALVVGLVVANVFTPGAGLHATPASLDARSVAGYATAAQSLKRYVNDVPWIHLDIAGTAYRRSASPFAGPGSTGAAHPSLVELAMGGGVRRRA